MKSKLDCPFCGDIAQLVTDDNDFYVSRINTRILVNFTNYQCDNCDESFTTNEADELNLNEIDKGIRRFSRKNKIKNLIK